eukprot:COSAG02_NODE_1775_length_10966_cov_4.412073_3_plen_153_part_00
MQHLFRPCEHVSRVLSICTNFTQSSLCPLRVGVVNSESVAAASSVRVGSRSRLVNLAFPPSSTSTAVSNTAANKSFTVAAAAAAAAAAVAAEAANTSLSSCGALERSLRRHRSTGPAPSLKGGYFFRRESHTTLPKQNQRHPCKWHALARWW